LRPGDDDAREHADGQERRQRFVEQADAQDRSGDQPRPVVTGAYGPDTEPGNGGPDQQIEGSGAE
jgi:hypothetical protein